MFSMIIFQNIQRMACKILLSFIFSFIYCPIAPEFTSIDNNRITLVVTNRCNYEYTFYTYVGLSYFYGFIVNKNSWYIGDIKYFRYLTGSKTAIEVKPNEKVEIEYIMDYRFIQWVENSSIILLVSKNPFFPTPLFYLGRIELDKNHQWRARNELFANLNPYEIISVASIYSYICYVLY